MKLQTLLDKMWNDYIELNEQAQRIVTLLEAEGESIVNDHIALRTFDHPKVNIDVLAEPFLSLGYKAQGEYDFPQKKLYAQHFEHENPKMPKIFISQLLLKNFSLELQNEIENLVSQIDEKLIRRTDFSSSGRPWDFSFAKYKKFKQESEYAAWVGAFGFKPNHFTISLNHLSKFSDLGVLNEFLKANGFILNDEGGEIKGGPKVYLEQSSTMANKVKVKFSDEEAQIPSCYFEFAKRYPLENGRLYQGFVATSADKIFESTDSREK